MPSLPLEKIVYWTKGEAAKNFGDYLTELFLERLFTGVRRDGARYRLIGSVIDDWIINDDLKDEADRSSRLVFWCCGKRDERPLMPESLLRATFFGVRGPLSRQALDLPPETALGDPGLLLPLLYRPRPADTAGQTICVPHILDPGADLLARSGTERLVSPAVADMPELLRLIDRIASASFVLAGSLHAAILACAYGRPFGFWDSGHIDVPFKWRDFAASVGIEARFAKTLSDARTIYSLEIAPNLKRPRLSPLLACAPLKVRPSIRLRGWLFDLLPRNRKAFFVKSGPTQSSALS